MKVFLIGFMGSGKSTFGRALAGRAGWDFMDTDTEIERLAGASIPEIFETKGEEWFRRLENQVLESLAEVRRDTVVALGGGTVCREGAMEALNAAGSTVYLKMSPGKLVRRLDEAARNKRPKIKGMDELQLLEFIGKALPEREKFYNMATFVLDCDAIGDERIIDLLVQQVRV